MVPILADSSDIFGGHSGANGVLGALLFVHLEVCLRAGRVDSTPSKVQGRQLEPSKGCLHILQMGRL